MQISQRPTINDVRTSLQLLFDELKPQQGQRKFLPRTHNSLAIEWNLLLVQSPGQLSVSKPHLGEQHTALWDYQPQSQDQLTLRRGDVVEVLDRSRPGWWYGMSRGATGFFPANYVTLAQ